jgi:inorganic triphosphatase YgiF
MPEGICHTQEAIRPMNEIELKLLLDAKQERLLRSGAAVKRAAAGAARTRQLHSVYFDTADGALARSGIALRLRKDGGRWVQTVKKSRAAITQGLSTPIEDECRLPGPELDLTRIADDDLREEVIGLAKAGIAPTVETAFRRTSRLLSGQGGAKIELAIDVGELRANGAAAPLAEAELEVKEGPQDAVFSVARDLMTRGPVRFSNRSKAARAGALREGQRAVDLAAPVKAAPARLDRSTTVEEAAVASLSEIQGQIAGNIVATVETDSLEGPHQLRIGLRRLRSALGAFAPALGCAELERLSGVARDIGATVGTLRDLDVLAEDILAPAAGSAPDEPGFAVLSEAVARHRQAARAEVRQALAGPEVAAFVLDLAGFVATRGWRAGGADPAALDAGIRGHARRALDKRWKAVKKRAQKLDELSTAERHELRKKIKKLRYVTEIFESLYPAGKPGKFRGALKRLQDDFGKLNDAKMVETALIGPRAPGAGDLDAQRASGRVIGAALAEAAHLWPRVAGDWRALAERGPFWR